MAPIRPPVRPAATLASALVLALASGAGPVRANERHFAYTYESAVLPPGGRELEVWTTARVGREDFYARFDQRLEFEVGLTDRVMTAFYLNTTATRADAGPGAREGEFEFAGISSEWKVKLGDPVADAVGLALYGEVSGGPGEAEIEAKLILDKQVGGALLAANVVGAHEWDYEGPDTETEQEIEIDLAGSWTMRPGVTAGLEIRSHNEIVDGEWEHSALFAGPVLGYATEEWWAVLTVLPQLPAPKQEHGGGDRRILDEHEKVNARLLFSFHL